MVANLTVGKKGYEAAWEDLRSVAEEAQELKAALIRAVDEDAEAFNRVMEAMRLPKATEEQQAERDKAVADASRHAANVPLETARLCLEVLRLGQRVAESGNRNSASDAGVAALVARAGVEGASLNVLINLGSISDERFTRECRHQVDALVSESRRICDAVQERVKSTFK